MIDAASVKTIVAAVNAQYVEQIDEDWVGYRKQNIRTMVEQLQTWYIITTKEKIAIKAHFLEPWSDTPNAHITTLAPQLDRRQVEYEDHWVTVTKADKVDYFVAQMYACEF